MVDKDAKTPSFKHEFAKQVETAELNFVSEDRITRGKRLGSGSFSIVYKAELAQDGDSMPQFVAFKELKPNRLEFQTQRTALFEEACILRKLRHPNVVGYVGCGLAIAPQATLFMVQELVSGGSLDGYMEKLRRRRVDYDPRESYSLRSALRWCIQTAAAVAHLHAPGNGIIHRDIKLSNLLLTDSDLTKADVKLADFGLAVDITTHSPSQETSNLPDSQTNKPQNQQSPKSNSHWWSFGLIKKRTDLDLREDAATEEFNDCYDLSQRIGSYLYMAPEVFLGLPYNEKADVYSLGLVLAEVLIGKPLSFCILPQRNYDEARNFALCMTRGLRLRCPRSFPKHLASILERCWQCNPRERPTALEVMEVFQSYDASCKNAESLLLFKPISLSWWQTVILANASNIKS